MVLLGSKVPTVRMYAADRLYVAILMLARRAGSHPAQEGWSSVTLKNVQALLCSVNWSTVDGVKRVKAARDQILGALDLDPPAKKEQRKVKAAAESSNTQSSYKNLVYDFARGM